MNQNNQLLKLVLLRHGESEWNQENRFTGWVDVDLSEKGLDEAKQAADQLKKHQFHFDIAYTSLLKRANKTLFFVLSGLNEHWIPVIKDWRLNERHYGGLQGLNKKETASKYGKEQVLLWRRSYKTKPPLLVQDSPYDPRNDRRYQHLRDDEIPFSECLYDTVKRFLPFWDQTIKPSLKKGKQVLIVAHGNSLRALIKHLDQVSDEDIIKLNIPTGIPLVYELNKETLFPTNHYYLESKKT